MANEVFTSDLRVKLKNLILNELEQLPDTLAELEPKERLNILCRLIPFVMPKVESVSFKQGEPDEFKLNVWHD